jgi:O-antigen ligase
VSAVIIIGYWIASWRRRRTGIPREYRWFIAFLVCHTVLAYTIFFREEFQIGYLGTADAVTSDGFEIVLESVSIRMSRFVLFALFTCALVSLCRSSRDLTIIGISNGFGVLVAGCVSVSVFSLNTGGYAQNAGGFLDPNVWGFTAMKAVWMNAYVLTSGRRAVGKWLSLIFIGYAVLSVILSGSRAAILSLCIGIIVVLSQTRRRSLKVSTCATYLIVGLAAYQAWNSDALAAVQERFAMVRSDGGSGRLSIWYEYIRRSPTYAVVGVGNGRSRSVVANSQALYSPPATHSMYLETVVEYGVVGLALLVLLLYRIGARLVDAVKHQPWAMSHSVMLAFYVAIVLNCAFLNVYGVRALWLSLGVVFVYLRELGGDGVTQEKCPLLRRARLRQLNYGY